MKFMKILLLTDEYYPNHIGGAGVVASQIITTLQERNIECILTCSNPKNKYLRKLYTVTWPLWSLAMTLISLLRMPDKIIVNDLRSAYILGLIGTRKVLDKAVYVFHGTEIDIVYKSRSTKNSLICLSFFYSKFLRSCGKVIYVSNYVSNRVQEELNLRSIYVKNQCVSYAGLNSQMRSIAMSVFTSESEETDTFRLVSFSRLEKRKGYLEMISIFETLIQSGIKLTWDIYGQGSLHSTIVSIIKERKLGSYIRVLGKIDRHKIINEINPDNYDAYWLLPNEPEAFGLTFIECSAVGLPVIGPKKYGIEEAISEKNSGFFYTSAAQFISDLMNIKNNKHKFITSCKHWASRFDADNFIKDVLS